MKHSEETKRKMSLSHIGMRVSDETRKKMSITRKGRKFSQETRERMRKAKLGKPNVNLGKRWFVVKDRSKLVKSEKQMYDSGFKYWSKAVKDRDGGKCKLSSAECSGRIEVHHIFDWKNYPELRYLITNGITLCHFHHPRGREEEKRMVPIFQELLSVSKEQNWNN